MIEIRYRCRCMLQEAVVLVRNRRDDEDVVQWVEQIVGNGIGRHHARTSPDCRSTVTDYVKIPAPENAPYIGGAPKLDA